MISETATHNMSVIHDDTLSDNPTVKVLVLSKEVALMNLMNCNWTPAHEECYTGIIPEPARIGSKPHGPHQDPQSETDSIAEHSMTVAKVISLSYEADASNHGFISAQETNTVHDEPPLPHQDASGTGRLIRFDILKMLKKQRF